jgi:hypothetical protein
VTVFELKFQVFSEVTQLNCHEPSEGLLWLHLQGKAIQSFGLPDTEDEGTMNLGDVILSNS